MSRSAGKGRGGAFRMDFDSYACLRMSLDDDGVLTAVMQTGEKMNAMTEQLHTELAEVWGEIGRDDRIKAVVITGEGDAFSAGGEISWVKQLS